MKRNSAQVMRGDEGDPGRVDKALALRALAEHRESLGVADDACMMCLLASGRAHPQPIWQSDDAVVVLDRFGARRGHLLVIAKDHIEDLSELCVEKYLDFQRLAHDGARALRSLLDPARIFIASLGASQGVPTSFPHFHLHVIPVAEQGEGSRPARVFSWSEGVVLYEDAEAEHLVRELRAHFRPSARAMLRGMEGRG